MMQTKSNKGPIENPVLSQALGGDNGSAVSSSCKTIPKVLQESARGNALPVGESVQLSNSQKAFKNPGIMGAENLMEVDALLHNERFDGEDEIAIEIKQLKKK